MYLWSLTATKEKIGLKHIKMGKKRKNKENPEITLSEFLRLYNSIYQGCLMYIARNFPNFDDEETRDICSDTMTKAFSKFHTYDTQKGAFTTWLYTIAFNTAIDHANEHKKQPNVTASLPSPISDEDDDFSTDIIDTDSKSPMDMIVEKEMEEKKRLQLAKLSQVEQSIIAMREEGLQFKDIALLLNMPATTARTKYRRATLKLKDLMEISDDLD